LFDTIAEAEEVAKTQPIEHGAFPWAAIAYQENRSSRMRLLKPLALAAVLIASPAMADTYTYACHERDSAHLYAAKIDSNKKTLTWRGSVYRNLKLVGGGDVDCAKDAYQATRRDGATAALCTATQGVATLQVLVGSAPGGDGVEELECDLVRE
jgi:hypothetical protein